MMEQWVTAKLQFNRTQMDELTRRLTTAFIEARQRVGANKPTVLVSVTVPLQLALEDIWRRIPLHTLSVSQFFWSSPRQERVLLGVGETQTLVVRGAERFDQLKRAVKTLQSNWVYHETDKPKFLGGFSFQPGSRTGIWAGWEDGRFVLPRFLFEVNFGNKAELTISEFLQVDQDPVEVSRELVDELWTWVLEMGSEAGENFVSHPNEKFEAEDSLSQDGLPSKNRPRDLSRVDWEALVSYAVKQIQTGGLRKVVLARCQSLRFKKPISIPTVLNRLRERYPESFTFSISAPSGSFTGASPERLVRVENGVVDVDALAGTAARGSTTDADDELGRQLLNSIKDRTEHAVVVERIRSEIAGLVQNISVPSVPVLKKLANVQHLFTPIQGRVDGTYSVIDFVARLHPTPAVAGEPREVALDVIAEHEGLDRGWYASPVGWFDPLGDGEFSVALRSALIQGEQACLFAGAGIMADSNPSLEWEETQMKLQAMRMALMQE